MKKIVASVGLVALGATSISTLHAQDISSAPSKSWNVSANLRGFFDDNINAEENNKDSSFGVEISPGASLNWGNDQTTIKAGYQYGYKQYGEKLQNTYGKEGKSYYQTHTFDSSINHVFNERYRVNVGDVFLVGQEPELSRASGGSYSVQKPISGENIHNYGTIFLNAQITPNFGAQLGYANEWVNYADNGASEYNVNLPPLVTLYSPSRSGLLDRIGQTFSLDGQWQISPETTGVLGYQFQIENYTADEYIGNTVVNGIIVPVKSDSRDVNSHYVYIGADHVFRPDLSGGLRGGLRYSTYSNDPEGSSSKASPYVKANLRYTYTVDSYAELGVNYDRSPTDVVLQTASGDRGITKDMQAFVVYGSINHKITPKLTGNLMAQVQNSVYNGGGYDGDTQLFYNLGLNLKYKFNAHLSGEVGYSYDKLDSDIFGYAYDRNRIYLGLSAIY